MDLEWLFQTIRTQLVVRIDFAGTSVDPYQKLHVEIVGAREDDDGLDPFHIYFQIDGHDLQHKAVHTPLSYTSAKLPDRKSINAYLHAIADEWCSDWQVQQPNVLRIGQKTRREEELTWRALPVPCLHFLLIMARVQGAFDEYIASSLPAHFDGSFALDGAQSRLIGLMSSQTRELTRPLQRLTDGM